VVASSVLPYHQDGGATGVDGTVTLNVTESRPKRGRLAPLSRSATLNVTVPWLVPDPRTKAIPALALGPRTQHTAHPPPYASRRSGVGMHPRHHHRWPAPVPLRHYGTLRTLDRCRSTPPRGDGSGTCVRSTAQAIAVTPTHPQHVLDAVRHPTHPRATLLRLGWSGGWAHNASGSLDGCCQEAA